MPKIEVSDVLHDLLERHAKKSQLDSVKDLVNTALMEYLLRHDRMGQLHVPLPTFLMSSADTIASVRSTMNTIDWYSSQESIDRVSNDLESAEELLRKTAWKLSKKLESEEN
ncbi:MAG: hypothetical protein BAJATHORv1_40004 [Candidatus Thorarchaeota archaeon]|nr:MAG: hypothetical protein BAJATHORv1_40004 [Candidatus Thorarchaeota archaeon]